MNAADPNVVEFLGKIDERIGHVLENPGAYGGIEAIEPVALVLFMLRARVVNADAEDRSILRNYKSFLASRVPHGCGGLRSRLGDECELDRMVEVLREYFHTQEFEFPAHIRNRTRKHG